MLILLPVEIYTSVVSVLVIVSVQVANGNINSWYSSGIYLLVEKLQLRE